MPFQAKSTGEIDDIALMSRDAKVVGRLEAQCVEFLPKRSIVLASKRFASHSQSHGLCRLFGVSTVVKRAYILATTST